jgi:hypothetical protein
MVAGGLVLALVMGLAGFAIANNGDVIYACVNNNSGTVKIVDAETVCAENSTLLSWNQQGVPGTDGTDGTDGTEGTDGAPGISGYEQVVQTEMLVDAQVGDFITAGVACPDGKKVLGGGAQGFISAVVVSSSPRTGDDSQWDTIFRVTEASSLVTVSAHAICGFVAS